MELVINGKPTHPDKVCFNDGMNFGQLSRPQRPGVQIGTYEMVFTRQEFVQKFAQQYDAIAEEMREIDADEGDLSEFGEIDYGPLSELLEHPSQLREIVEWHLARDHIFPAVLSRDTTGIIIDSVDDVRADEFVTISGRCRMQSAISRT